MTARIIARHREKKLIFVESEISSRERFAGACCSSGFTSGETTPKPVRRQWRCFLASRRRFESAKAALVKFLFATNHVVRDASDLRHLRYIVDAHDVCSAQNAGGDGRRSAPDALFGRRRTFLGG